MHCIKPVINRTVHQIGLRRDQFAPDDHGQEATNQEEEKSHHDVLDANHLGIRTESKVTGPTELGVIGLQGNGRGHGLRRRGEGHWIRAH